MATSERQQISPGRNPEPAAIGRIGLVAHPSRAIDAPLLELREWAAGCGVELVQVHAFRRQKQVAEFGDAADCDQSGLGAGRNDGRTAQPAAH